ncbi:hypothetical protein HPB47_018310 [Ixodes persulcatus]|uniref:Uncharacterized protein n=1 Tax=Ixodes persulcatus TaxID=34615 RepID=A0AC60QNM6_IXOPE|nr:hypothetical protein HPB47_018310 [Ixodes persulcatus]
MVTARKADVRKNAAAQRYQVVRDGSGMASGTATLSEELREPPDRGLLEREGSPDNGRGFSEPRFPPMNPGNSDGPVKPRVRCMDVNLYATKKSIAQGMMDIALLTANASQLKHLLHEGPEVNRFYGLTVACVALSIALQENRSEEERREAASPHSQLFQENCDVRVLA